MDSGCVYLVGAGPGDPGLLTLRGQALLKRADVVVYDRLIDERLLEHARPEARRIYVGKQAGKKCAGQKDINQMLISFAQARRQVVRLKGGDPCVFGRASQEAIALAVAGVRFEIVPGITAGLAAATYAGIPATDRELSSAVALVTAQEDPDKGPSNLDYRILAGWKGTLIFYMGVAALARTCRQLVENGMAGQTPAAVVQQATTGLQRGVEGTLDNIAQRAEHAKIEPPAVLIIGPTVKLREQLSWFERRPLFGRRIVNTRPLAQAGELSELLEELGAQVIHAPAICIAPPKRLSPIRQTVRQLEQYDWIIFTSVNGVDGLFKYLHEAGRDSRALGHCRICAIGPATAARLGQHGIVPDAQPGEFLSSAIVDLLASQSQLQGKRVLCPRPEHAPPDLIRGLQKEGATVEEVVAYRTVTDNARSHALRQALADKGVDWITFTSPSTARSLSRGVEPELIRRSGARLASIGPTTSAALRALGLEAAAEAKAHSARGLVDAILEAEGAGKA